MLTQIFVSEPQEEQDIAHLAIAIRLGVQL